jgi:hypothetical protein
MILTTIDGIPLYSTIAEALQWAQSRNLNGYHTHTYLGTVGYMGGFSHNTATVANITTLSGSSQNTITSSSPSSSSN